MRAVPFRPFAATHPAPPGFDAGKRLLSTAITAATAIAAVGCIHFGSGGIKRVNEHTERPLHSHPQSNALRPFAALEFAPPVADLDLPASAGDTIAPATF